MANSVIRHSGMVVPGIKSVDTVAYEKIMSFLCDEHGVMLCNGKLKHDAPIIEPLISMLQFDKDNAPIRLIDGHRPEDDGICCSQFTDRFITSEMKRELARPQEYSKPVDEEADDDKVSYTKREETKHILLVNDGAWLDILPHEKDKNPELKRQYEVLAIRLARAAVRYCISRGFEIDGMVYHYFTTSSGGLKQGKHYFISEDVYQACKPVCSEIAKLSKKANLAVSKHLQYLSLLLTDGNFLDIPGFVENAALVDISANKLLKTVINAKMVVPTHDENMECEIKDSSFDNNWSDGAILANSDYYARYNLHLVQLRALGVKGLAQFISFSHLAADLGLTDEQCQFIDAFGAKRDIRKVSCILDKNSFKYYKLLFAGEFTSLFNFFEHFGFTKFYATNVFANTISENDSWNFTKQFFSAYDRTAAVVEEIGKHALAELEKMAALPNDHEAFVKYMATLYSGQAEEAIMSLDVADGAAAYSDEALRKFEETYSAKYRDAFQKWSIDGHCLKAMPDIIALFCAYLGINHPGLCGDVDAVYCPAYTEHKVLINRNPVLANDTAVQKNLYRYNNLWNKYACFEACYFGKMSRAPKMLGADFDGDSVNVTNNAVLIERIQKSNENIEMPMIAYYDLKEGFIAEESLKDFSGNFTQIADCIVYAKHYTKYVGISAARISQAFREINKAAASDDYARASSIYLHDIAPLAITEQLAVDASKTLAFYEWNKSGSVLGSDWYDDTKNGRMITKEYRVMSSDKSESFKYYRSDAEHPCNLRSGKDDCWFDDTNIGAMHDFFASRVPHHVIFNVAIEYGMNYEFDPDDFTATQVSGKLYAKLTSEHPYDKTMFGGNWTPADKNYKLTISKEVSDIFDKYGIKCKKVMDAKDFFRDVVGKMLKSKSYSHFRRIVDVQNVYYEMSKHDKNAYFWFARAYKLGDISKNCLLEATTRKVNGETISDAAMFVRFGAEYFN